MGEEFIRFTALGVGSGGLYALAAIGVVLIYRCSGVVNFAQGSVGMVGAYVYYEFHVQHGWPWPIAMVLGFGGSAFVGVVFHFAVMHRLRDASVLTRIVATVALLISLQGIAFLRYGAFPKLVPSILPSEGVEIFGTSVGQDRVAILGIAVVLTAVLWAIYRYTTFGVATSAVAENQRAAAALAVSPGTIAAANWAIGSALGALASILLVPITGLEPSSASFLVIPVLAAAVIGRFSSFPIATGAGVLIGVSQSLVASPKLVANHWHQPGLATAMPFVLVAAVLIIRGRAVVAKEERFGRMPRLGTGRPAPGLIVFGFLVSLLCLWVVFPDNWVTAFQVQIIVAVVLMSFIVVTGYAGQVSLAQGAFAGIGALVCGWLDLSKGWPIELAALAGLAATVPVSLIVGLAGVRTRGVNLAIVTLGFAIAIGPAVFANPTYTGGSAGGFKSDNVTFLGIELDPIGSPARYGTFALIVLVAIGLMVANLRRGRAGRRLIAVRTNERVGIARGFSGRGQALRLHARWRPRRARRHPRRLPAERSRLRTLRRDHLVVRVAERGHRRGGPARGAGGGKRIPARDRGSGSDRVPPRRRRDCAHHRRRFRVARPVDVRSGRPGRSQSSAQPRVADAAPSPSSSSPDTQHPADDDDPFR